MRKQRKFTVGIAAALLLLLGTAAPGSGSGASGMTYLDNGRIRVGVNLDDGGKITFLAAASGPRSGTNLVAASLPSYYRNAFGDSPAWGANADYSTVLAASNDGHEIYTKVMAGTNTGSPCECTIEQWVRIDGPVAHIRNRLTNFLSDAGRYPAAGQELPALYTLGPAYRLFTYVGAAPYTNSPLREYTRADGGYFFSGSGVPSIRASEHWAALVGDDLFGVGLVEPDHTRFAGIAGSPGSNPYALNGYLTAPTLEILDGNATYSNEYTLVVGTVSRIRAYAYAHRPDSRPDYQFRTDRQSWWYVNASDRGAPIRGALRVDVGQDDPIMVGPEGLWRARNVPRIYVRGRWHTQQNVAEVFWSVPGRGTAAERSRRFKVVPDGIFHTYRVDLFRTPTYRGAISGLRLDPVYGAEPGGLVDVTCISWKPCPVDRKRERRLVWNDQIPFLEDFSNELGQFWWVGRTGIGPTLDVANGQLELGIPSTATPDQGQEWIAVNVQSRCRLVGDFDVQVDFRLLEWPARNGVHVEFAVADQRALVRLNGDREQIVAWFPPHSGSVDDDSLTGSLRLVRAGGRILGYYRRDGRWAGIAGFSYPQRDGYVRIGVGASARELGEADVVAAFDNVRINSGSLRCP
jgi:hypothetical protein